jgi:cell division protein FtsB
VNSRRSPAVRAPKPNEHERAQRQAAVEILLRRALHGVLSVPEAAVLADYWRAERELADKTRRSLGETTRALQRNREAADAEIRRLEARVAELEAETGTEVVQEATDGAQGVQEAANGARDVRGAARAADGRTGPQGEAAA